MELYRNLSNLGEKKAGSKEGIAARNLIKEYATDVFKVCDKVKIHDESFAIQRTDQNKAKIKINDLKFEAHLYDNTGVSGNVFKSKLHYAGYFISRSEGKKVKDKIVVFKFNPVIHRLFQVIKAYQKNVGGIILVSNNDEYIQRGLGYPYLLGNLSIPVVGILKKDWEMIKAQRKLDSEVELEIEYETKIIDAKASNIIVDIPNGFEKKIVIGAHFDSWFSGNHDNCIAVQMAFDLASNLVKTNLNHSLRIILFDAEETGLLGSYHHVENNPDVADYKFYLNLEMPVPTKKGILRTFLYTSDKFVKKSISFLQLLKLGMIPVSFSFFYKLLPSFPADVEFFNRRKIPSATTYCSNPYQHTPRDNDECIRFEYYPKVLDLLEQTIKRMDE